MATITLSNPDLPKGTNGIKIAGVDGEKDWLSTQLTNGVETAELSERTDYENNSPHWSSWNWYQGICSSQSNASQDQKDPSDKARDSKGQGQKDSTGKVQDPKDFKNQDQMLLQVVNQVKQTVHNNLNTLE